MRAQWCREHIDEAAKHCGLKKSTVSDVKQAAEFCADHSEISECSTDAIMPLIRIKDADVKARAISLVENSLNDKTPTGGKKKGKFTKSEMTRLIQKAELEVRGEITQKIKATRKPAEPVLEAPPVTNADRERKALLNPPESPAPIPTPAPDTVIGGCRTLKEAEEGADVPGIVDPRQPLEPRKDKHYYAEELLRLMPESTRKEVDQLLKEHTSWKTVDVFYFGIQALAAPPGKKT